MFDVFLSKCTMCLSCRLDPTWLLFYFSTKAKYCGFLTAGYAQRFSMVWVLVINISWRFEDQLFLKFDVLQWSFGCAYTMFTLPFIEYIGKIWALYTVYSNLFSVLFKKTKMFLNVQRWRFPCRMQFLKNSTYLND